jgi:hypothetical protein
VTLRRDLQMAAIALGVMIIIGIAAFATDSDPPVMKRDGAECQAYGETLGQEISALQVANPDMSWWAAYRRAHSKVGEAPPGCD